MAASQQHTPVEEEAPAAARPGERETAPGPAGGPPASTKPGTQKPGRRRRVETTLFTLPAFLFQLSWGWYPMIMAFVLSFTDAALRRPVQFTGLESYQRIWDDPLVAQSFRVTAVYTVLSITLTFFIPIFVAILLMEMSRRHIRWMMLLWFLPLSGVASTVLFRYMFNAQYGLFQWVATKVLGLPPQPFLNSADQVLFWLVVPGILFFGPGLIYMATLQSIPASYFEAAEIEGAGFWRKMWTISLPRLRPIISMLLIFAIIGSTQAFEFPTIMTGAEGSPGGAARTVVMYLFQLLQQLRYADATALGVYLFVITMTLVVIQRRFFREDPDT
ncbi:carbohydrate ABC transporter permease [Streptomyces jeddahensis]|uniref:L-arabinose transport system permease protein AraP n=1 Tax=Streptomyces jeddahensis TaxID=1716141 RepID=A0A177HMV2_9ACTN|nr:sugar ABC transporter permease [Streptomyces jeddahensis]OAH12332.1 L-arabinose transport system permease protein AraP [Streptomyces jeddahensis]